MTTVPFAAVVTSVIVRGSFSGSESLFNTLTATGVLNGVVSVSLTASGLVFPGSVILIVTVAVSVPPLPSIMV